MTTSTRTTHTNGDGRTLTIDLPRGVVMTCAPGAANIKRWLIDNLAYLNSLGQPDYAQVSDAVAHFSGLGDAKTWRLLQSVTGKHPGEKWRADQMPVPLTDAPAHTNGTGPHLNGSAPDLAPIQPASINSTGQHDQEARPIEQLGAVDQFLVKTPATDYGNALCVQRLYGDQFATNEAFGLMFYDGKRWTRQNAEAMLSDSIIKTLKRRGKLSFDYEKGELTKKSTLNNTNINACKSRFLELPELYMRVDQFDAQPHLLNCKNGIVNLQTGELLKHDQRYFLTHITDVNYKINADQSPWLSFLPTVIGDYQDDPIADYIQMSAGYSATGETTEHALFYLFGPKGRNGKGTVADILQTVMGDYASGCQFNTLTRSRENGDQGFDIAALHGRRWVFTSESGKESELNEASVKALTGQDTIQVAHKGRDPFSFKPEFKIWALSNHEPKGDVDDDSFWDRLKVILFPNSFREREDKTLRKRLTRPEILEGVLAWIVDGAVMWYLSGSAGLRAPDQVREHGQAIRDAQDSVRSWVKNDCITGEGIAFCSNKALHDAYSRWCRENEREDEKTPDAMGKRLARMEFERKISGKGNNRIRGFVGIRPKDPVERGDFTEG